MLRPGAKPNAGAPFQLSLAVIGAPPTWVDSDGEPVVFEPYVREMQVWAGLFAAVEVCSPPGEGPVRGNLCRYSSENIEWTPCRYSETFDGLRYRIRRLFQLPGACLRIARTILRNDVVLLRSPTHFGLVGAVIAPVLGRPSITKWAGYNGPTPGERLPSVVNRWIESVVIGRHAMLVYGPAKGRQQVSFIPALMSRREIAEARRMSSAARTWEGPWKLLCVGRLAYDKNFELVIRALGIVRRTRPDLRWTFTLVGDGLMRNALETVAARELNGDMTFSGALSFHKVQEFYAASHMAIMPGVEEGWPKVIAEAWAHGAIPVAAAAGLVPSILASPGAGVMFHPDPESLANVLIALMSSPQQLRQLSAGLDKFAHDMSLESFSDRLKDVLINRLKLQPVHNVGSEKVHESAYRCH